VFLWCVRVSKSILVFNKITQTSCSGPSSALLGLNGSDTLAEKVTSQPVTAIALVLSRRVADSL